MNIFINIPGMDWRQRFKDYLRDEQLSQSEIAARIGVTQGGLGHWLSGRREINLSDFMALCKASGANAQFILFGEGDSKSLLLAEIRKLVRPEPPALPPVEAKKPTHSTAQTVKHKKNKQLA